ncbi:MAG: LysM peptidoglycan-binding domain-containing protein [Anaerolineae bacterium]|nr:LysM peptidoglycan-binding domain-containing protein [Anaerolineae bacterium]
MTWANSYRKFLRFVPVLAAVVLVMAAPLLHTSAQTGNTHVVQGGENLFRIALRYNTTVETLAAANGITDPARIYAGQTLVIPSAQTQTNLAAPANPIVLEAAPVVPAVAVSPVYHTIQRGETLAAIGQRYGVNWNDIVSTNNLSNPNQIFVGQQLLIPGANAPAPAVAPPVEAAPAAAQVVSVQRSHVVQQGENLAAIGRAYGVSWPTIARANNITDPNHIYSGQTLVIPASDDGQGTFFQPSTGLASAPVPPIGSGKEIFVDLSDQRVYAYENGQMIRTTLASTGLPGTATVQGDFRVYTKYTSQLMSGPGYYLPGVPYVMYFYQDYSLHGTYWHSNFGNPMSHGCVNLPTPEAEWLFNWAEIGTPVHVEW